MNPRSTLLALLLATFWAVPVSAAPTTTTRVPTTSTSTSTTIPTLCGVVAQRLDSGAYLCVETSGTRPCKSGARCQPYDRVFCRCTK